MGHDQKYVDKKYEVVGERFNRPDGIDKVTGKARYGADASAPGQLVGRVLRSPHAHAKILKINTAKAEKLPGVKAVVTFEDMPDLTGGDQGLADILENCMARGRALYDLSLIHISEPTRQAEISYAVFCLKKKKII